MARTDLATNIIRPSGWLLFVENTKKGQRPTRSFVRRCRLR